MNHVVAGMRLEGPSAQPLQDELEVLCELVPLDGARLLELGCGAAEKTRQIAERTGVASIVAAEVDRVQLARHLASSDLTKVTFKSYGAEAIDEPDASFDAVVMFKSLHHVPVPRMDAALAEIHRVLKPGGLAYLSEPVFAGSFNEVIRLFHDESVVRREAFQAVARAVGSGGFELVTERFFFTMLKLESFAQFERGVLNVTHTEHEVSPALLARVRATFECYRSERGYVFEIPNRVDLLRKVAES
jgi:ubiquinone/menaquinone biosynthesis C-methylase UbiE